MGGRGWSPHRRSGNTQLIADSREQRGMEHHGTISIGGVIWLRFHTASLGESVNEASERLKIGANCIVGRPPRHKVACYACREYSPWGQVVRTAGEMDGT